MRICVITSGHLATCPRMVKAADALAEAGHAVRIVSAQFLDWAAEADRRWGGPPGPLGTPTSRFPVEEADAYHAKRPTGGRPRVGVLGAPLNPPRREEFRNEFWARDISYVPSLIRL